MLRLQVLKTGLAVAAVFVLIAGVLLAQATFFAALPDGGLARGPKTTAPQPAAQPEVNREAAEQGEAAAAHREAFEQAVGAGTAGVAVPINGAPATGWAGEQLVSAAADDWEPAVATDPHTGPQGQSYAYLLTTRYASTKPCPGNCPTPYIALYTSSNAGATWSGGVPIRATQSSKSSVRCHSISVSARRPAASK